MNIDNKYYLGMVCLRGHQYKNTKKSLRYRCSNACIGCAKELNKKYREENPKRYREWQSKRYKGNLVFRLNKCVSTGMNTSLKNIKNGNCWKDLVGYVTEELITHLESLFTNKMTWNNYGSCWEIDHIVPRNLFSFQTSQDLEFKLCWALKNLRPLEKEKNHGRPKDGSDLNLDILKMYGLDEEYLTFI